MPKPPHPTGWWEIVRYALDSNARAIRLCVILIVISSPGLAVAVPGLLPHLMSMLVSA